MKRLNRIGILLIVLSGILLSCASYQEQESTGWKDNTIKVEYELEIVDQEFCKIHSLSTDRYYMIELDSIHVILEYDNM